jgi:hypothetical protein
VRRLIALIVIVFALFIGGESPPLQAQSGIVTLNINVGFGGRFRDNMWTPVQIKLQNSGAPFSGTLIIRPERTRGLTNPVSTPVDLARDAVQTFTLYVSLRSFAETMRVELLTSDGLIAAEAEARVTVILPRERLYVRISDTLSSSIDLSSAVSAGQVVTQANIGASDIPDRAIGLEAVDVLILSDTDTSSLSLNQFISLREWVTSGGHLITTGGANYQATAAGLQDLLPLKPDASITSEDFGGLTVLSGAGYAIEENTVSSIIATGVLQNGARVLAQDTDDNPLVARRLLGAGVIDYLTFDPLAAPFNSWSGQSGFWLSLISTREPRPSWASGFVNIAQGYPAIEILPGVTVLPEATAMAVFLVLYIFLIGPINYLVLSRIGRRELAWVTIPALILVFTVAAWVTGFNLRGEEVILSRLSVVESWSDSSESRVRQLIGLLAPRRANYNFALEDGRALRPLLRASTGFLSNSPNTVQIVQDDAFRAVNFPVDASFMAGFVTEGRGEIASIDGALTVLEGRTGEQWRGSIQSNLPIPLTDAVLLSRHGVYRLNSPFEAGELRVIEADIPYRVDARSHAAPLQYATGFAVPAQARYTVRGRTEVFGPEMTIRDIVGDNQFSTAIYYGLAGAYLDQTLDQVQTRRQLFLSNFMLDQFAANGRGDSIYLVGWTDVAPTTEQIAGAGWQTVDTTLYITELSVTRQPASGRLTTVRSDEFTWLTVSDEGATGSTPNNIQYYTDGALSYRFTPVPDKHLAEVRGLTLVIEETNVSFSNVEIGLYDWRSGEYVIVELDGARTNIPRPERFIGPMNTVQVEIKRLASSGSLAISRLGIEQTGLMTTQ